MFNFTLLQTSKNLKFLIYKKLKIVFQICIINFNSFYKRFNHKDTHCDIIHKYQCSQHWYLLDNEKKIVEGGAKVGLNKYNKKTRTILVI